MRKRKINKPYCRCWLGIVTICATGVFSGSCAGLFGEKPSSTSTAGVISPRADETASNAKMRDSRTPQADPLLESVTASMSQPDLAQDMKALYIRSLSNRNISRLVRNNMAQALLNQSEKNPDLWKSFLSIIDDPTQDKEWRIFCMQHMANSAHHADNEAKQAIHQKLLEEVRNPDAEFSSRALLMLDELERTGNAPLAGQADAFVREILKNPTANELSVSTALGLIGSRKDRRYLPEARLLAREPRPEQRVAVATLGLIGEQSDVDLLRKIKAEPGSLLERAVQGAIHRLCRPRQMQRANTSTGNIIKNSNGRGNE